MNAPVANPATVAVGSADRPLVRIVIAGHVDHGKSTLIGRLLHETGGITQAKLDQLKAISDRRGMPFEWAFLLDALQTERDQGITIDTSQIRFRTASRDVVLIDAPGHTEFLRNMITGAAQADAAILIVDAAEGLQAQTRRHSHLLHLLGIRQVAVAVNKMDRVDFDLARFEALRAELQAHLFELGIAPSAFIPISARSGEGVAGKTALTAWHDGPTVLSAIDEFVPARPDSELSLRLPVQAVYKFDDRRIIAGRVETGQIATGDTVVVTPGGKTARVKSIEAWPVARTKEKPALAGQSVGIVLDRELFVERGDVISLATARPRAVKRLVARVFWLRDQPLTQGQTLTVRMATASSRAQVLAIAKATDPGALGEGVADAIAQNHVGEVNLTLTKPIAADLYERNPKTGRIVLEIDGQIAGGGIVISHDAAARGETLPADLADLDKQAARLDALLRPLSPAQRLVELRRALDGRLVFTTSFGLEDQVLTHWLAAQANKVEIVTLDTGRLFPEVYDLWAQTEQRYGFRIRAFYPDTKQIEELVARQGINGFYDSREARASCCRVRKVVPLDRALAGAQAWVTGLRADQSDNRSNIALVSVDSGRRLLKINPLFDQARSGLEALADEYGIPVNPLHARGFVSIGCAPCTRAISPGEPERAGRWWWEEEGKKECGLHTRQSPAS
ncbi:MAG: phosphoadenylyl-sulfate reductase [Pseudorhodoplanes sp.]